MKRQLLLLLLLLGGVGTNAWVALPALGMYWQ